MAAINGSNMIRYKAEKLASARDIILALTCDEEGGAFNGVEYLIKHHRNLIDAEITLNEGGGGSLDKDGKRILHGIQAGEDLPELCAGSDQQGRPQLGAGRRQRALPPV